jgi:outer membrane DcaP-like protein
MKLGRWIIGLLGLLALSVVATGARAQGGTKAEVYGFAMLDMGYQTKQNDPAWFDVLRPTKLPSFDNQFGQDGRWFSSVRQTRFGVKTSTPTDHHGDLKTQFEFEMFGVGADAGQTTIRLRHAYGELGQFGAGQTWSPFMDIDVFPNSVEYWGPNGMAFFRNVQVRWMPLKGESFATIALERPGASGDAGVASEIITKQNVQARFALPDLSGEYRKAMPWGYVEGAGIVRQIQWDDNNPASPDVSGDATGWGFNLSSNIKLKKSVARLSVLYGEGIENYLNDAPVDVAVEDTTATTFEGKALPILGVSAFIDINWNERWSSTAGYSMVDIDNSAGQRTDAFKTGHYALGNLMYYPVKNVMAGVEVQWGDRENKGGFTSDDVRIQFTAKYNFSVMFGGGQ